ncbi:MAG TPA: amidohydrolase family protein [Acidimicrobiales bacterium]|nr:amidohydrolase family protein [Acidimicrobiales bacterium]
MAPIAALDDHYTIISADCHAGGSHEMYREYLDPAWRDEFDAWRAKYKNPFRDLQDGGRVRNWDDERRNGDLEADGIVGEVVFPNTVPPFFPNFVLFARPPTAEEFPARLAGIRAHNRWMADWCARFPERRAGIGQIFLNDVDEAVKDVEWCKEHGLRGGVLISAIPPDVKYVKPLYDPCYDPIWQACEDLGMPVNSHGGTGLPDYGRYAATPLLFITEVPFYSQRAFVQMLFAGVFERFPRLKFVMTEMGCAWLPPMLKHFDSMMEQIRATGRIGEMRYAEGDALPKSATEYFRQNCWVGASQPGGADVAAMRAIGVDKFMWGSDYPHEEGTGPYTREHLRQRFCDVAPDDLRLALGGNAAALYGFDLDALAPLADKCGPTVGEVATPLDSLPEHPNEALLRP